MVEAVKALRSSDIICEIHGLRPYVQRALRSLHGITQFQLPRWAMPRCVVASMSFAAQTSIPRLLSNDVERSFLTEAGRV